MDIVPFEGRTFEDLISSFSEAKRDYLYLRTVGVDRNESMRIANRKSGTAKVWFLNDPTFASLEEYLVDHRNEYKSQATAYLSANLARIDIGLFHLANRLNDWDAQKQGDKSYILRAAEMLQRIHPSSKGGSFDEVVLRRRREM